MLHDESEDRLLQKFGFQGPRSVGVGGGSRPIKFFASVHRYSAMAASKTGEVAATNLESIERAVVFDCEHVIVNGKDVSVSGQQVRQVKCFRLVTHTADCTSLDKSTRTYISLHTLTT